MSITDQDINDAIRSAGGNLLAALRITLQQRNQMIDERDAALAGAEGKLNGWHSVKDNLPRERHVVLMRCWNGSEYYHQDGMWDGKEWIIHLAYRCGSKVTHWRDLGPAPGDTPGLQP